MEEIKSMKVRIWLIAISLALVVGWEFSARQYSTLRLLVSSPSLITAYMKENAGTLLLDTGTTLWEAFCGLSIAVSTALSLMILCFWKPFLSRFLLPVMITSQVIPVIVLAPFFVILLGSGVSSKIAMAAVISFFPVFINFSQGHKAIPRSIHELYLINNASLAYRIKKVYFPLSTPSIMAGLKISATLASIGAIVAEFTGSDNGLGRNLFLSAIRLEPELMMCSLVLSAIIGGLLYLFIGLIERRVGKWYL